MESGLRIRYGDVYLDSIPIIYSFGCDKMARLILDILGNEYDKIKLYDDNSLSTGGISKEEETLGEFMEEGNISPLDNVGKLQKALKDCGIQQIPAIDESIENQVKSYIEDLEDELGITVDFTWDYVEFNE